MCVKINNVKFSLDNTKLGGSIPSVKLMPGITCRPDAPCAKSCYGKKGRFLFPNVKNVLEENTMAWAADPEAYEDACKKMAENFRYFRWHDNGDIPSAYYFEMMVRVAEACPHCKFLAFTKKYEIVNDYLDRHEGVLPENLNVVFSSWGEWNCKNPYNLPTSHVRFKGTTDEESFIPENAFQCPRYCGSCVNTGCSCWDLKRGESVAFDEH